VVAENAEKVVDTIVQRLLAIYMAIAEADPTHGMLHKISAVVRKAKSVGQAAKGLMQQGM